MYESIYWIYPPFVCSNTRLELCSSTGDSAVASRGVRLTPPFEFCAVTCAITKCFLSSDHLPPQLWLCGFLVIATSTMALTNLHQEHFKDLWCLWNYDHRRQPSDASLRAWCEAEGNLDPAQVSSWFTRRRNIAKAEGLLLSKETYDMTVEMRRTKMIKANQAAEATTPQLVGPWVLYRSTKLICYRWMLDLMSKNTVRD